VCLQQACCCARRSKEAAPGLGGCVDTRQGVPVVCVCVAGGWLTDQKAWNLMHTLDAETQLSSKARWPPACCHKHYSTPIKQEVWMRQTRQDQQGTKACQLAHRQEPTSTPVRRGHQEVCTRNAESASQLRLSADAECRQSIN
jgi:hypothetical protein